MPSVGYKVFAVLPAAKAAPAGPVTAAQSAGGSSVENARYKVLVDAHGDVASIVDKEVGRELLQGPIRLEMRDDPSPDKPAWRILYDTVSAPVREYVAAPAEVRVVEQGPVRAALEITRHAAGSTIVQRIALTDGGDRVDVANAIDWRSPNTLLKAAFALAATNPKASYDLGLGAIERGNNTPDHYEVPAQKWADLTDAGGAYGAAILNDSKYGWDKPADNVLRLTLLHTAKPRAYPYQSSNDLGQHHFTYSVAGHKGDWRSGAIPARAASLNQPLIAFQAGAHAGRLGRSVSLLGLGDTAGQVAVRALKKMEDGDEVVVRLQEQYGRPARTRVRLAEAIAAAREINAIEEAVGPVSVSAGELDVELKAYQPRSFALRLARRSQAAPTVAAAVLPLAFNRDGVSTDTDRSDGDFDGKKQTLAGELLPARLELDGVPFELGSSAPGALNILVPTGQTLPLPPGAFDHLDLLAAAVGGDVTTSLEGQTLTVREWQGPVGQWDSRLKEPRLLREVFVPPITQGQSWSPEAIQADLVVQFDPASGAVSGIDQIRPGFMKRDEVAWVGTHRHAPEGNQPYIGTYLFKYSVALKPGTRQVHLPRDERLRILAATAVQEPPRILPVRPLYAADLSEPVRSHVAK
jgi:alpha-mannosidase